MFLFAINMATMFMLLLCRSEDGISFADTQPRLAELIFVRISRDFYDKFEPLAALLFGSQSKEVKYECLAEKGQLSTDPVRTLLIKWREKEENPTGKVLYDALSDAGCPLRRLMSYKRIMMVRRLRLRFILMKVKPSKCIGVGCAYSVCGA